MVTDREGNPAFRCRFPGCEKTYASRDAVRKHGRINHLQWLRSCEFEHSAAGQRVASGGATTPPPREAGASTLPTAASEHVYAVVLAPAPADSEARPEPFQPKLPCVDAW